MNGTKKSMYQCNIETNQQSVLGNISQAWLPEGLISYKAYVSILVTANTNSIFLLLTPVASSHSLTDAIFSQQWI